ncbi:bifunctional riboflavin kinase/FAD synthetase [Paludibacter sp. 221]|uniref:bifunctional riboflavin kinase/FAD synthetase n=1 Tax=Paludibacter sp. 221 TaxID=2302939 RepID=UPI0013D68DCD|nr:bifunctional riboflavin kinase/FAD synthetase [Paludibacter sp. 221]NDV47773.1 bifunctional riboflavin kinase/FAD synthetase [Paludibacter sp. 221]
MKIIQPDHNQDVPYTATIGFFDGVHRGHRFIIEELKATAKHKGEQSLVITFGNHPRKVLHTSFHPQLLTTLSEKTELLESTGADACTVLDFTPELASMSAYAFMKNILRDKYNVKTLLIGYDHRFGYNREETFADYVKHGKELGIELIQADCFNPNETEHISSSEIRKALQRGDVKQANRLLGYNYRLSGEVVGGFKVGRKIGFPTANLKPENPEKLIPPIGVYAVQVVFENRTYAGMLNIGNRPTLNNGEDISIEVHIIDFEKDIYNRTIELRFVEKIRDEEKFGSIDELIERLKKDKEKVLEIMHEL